MKEERVRRLKGKDVYMMFDVSEGADKLVAGYTFFQPHQRSWPPHNHTDQEEVDWSRVRSGVPSGGDIFLHTGRVLTLAKVVNQAGTDRANVLDH